MIPQDMTILHKPEEGKLGDCFRACLASLFHLETTEVPHFVELPTGEWWDATVAWVQERGWIPVYIEASDWIPPGWSIRCGHSPRGFTHSVICLDGQMQHDPHPSQNGLVDTTGWMLFCPTATTFITAITQGHAAGSG